VTNLCDYDAIALAGMLRRREVSASEVVTAHIERVEAGAVEAATGYGKVTPGLPGPPDR